MTGLHYWSKCLINELKKLKESSKEAVENTDKFSDFKEYMHVKRQVESKLHDLILKAKQSNRRQLILVCGGVGDGKSHLLSYFKNKHGQDLEGFTLHNDATESFEPQKTSLETLNEVLDDFSDENIDKPGTSKLLLAINLGALANFIDGPFKDRYKQLSHFVQEKHILDAEIVTSEFDPESTIQFINFSDYHLFTLTSEGAKSDYITTILSRIVDSHPSNPFFHTYSTVCSVTCPVMHQCPVKANYEFLAKETVRVNVSNVLVESIIKYKLIVSTRALLNFVFYILVSNSLEQTPMSKMHMAIERLGARQYLKQILPTLMFEQDGVSSIHETLQLLDPTRRRTEQVDQLLITVNTRDEVSSFFEENVDATIYKPLNDAISSSTVRAQDHVYLKELTVLLLRFHKLDPLSEFLMLDDSIYEEYVRNLYWWNSKSKPKLRGLYDSVKEAIYGWSGTGQVDYINLNLGKPQNRFRLLEYLPLQSVTDAVDSVADRELDRFLPFMILSYSVLGQHSPFSVPVDYALYELLMRIRKGYRPNRVDKNNFVNFVAFIDLISQQGTETTELIFESRASDPTMKYTLAYDPAFGDYIFREMS